MQLARVLPMHVLRQYMGQANIKTTTEHSRAAETQDADRAWAAIHALSASAAPPKRKGDQDAAGPKKGAEGRTDGPRKTRKPRSNRGLLKRGGRDSNPQPPDRQSGTLTN